MKYATLEDRIIKFSAEAMKLTFKLPNKPQGRHISNQLMRSSSSISLNYGEASASESRKDFIHKIKVSLKELRETHICLKLIIESELCKKCEMEDLEKEAGELTAILITSIKTAQLNSTKNSN